MRQWHADSLESFDELVLELTDFRDLGDRVLAFGRIRARGLAHVRDPISEPPLQCVREGPTSCAPYDVPVIFKRVGEGRPYPDHHLDARGWAALPPRQVRLDELVTTKDTLQLATLLDEDSTFFGDLFAHVVEWRDDLQQRLVLHARVLVVDDVGTGA